MDSEHLEVAEERSGRATESLGSLQSQVEIGAEFAGSKQVPEHGLEQESSSSRPPNTQEQRSERERMQTIGQRWPEIKQVENTEPQSRGGNHGPADPRDENKLSASGTTTTVPGERTSGAHTSAAHTSAAHTSAAHTSAAHTSAAQASAANASAASSATLASATSTAFKQSRAIKIWICMIVIVLAVLFGETNGRVMTTDNLCVLTNTNGVGAAIFIDHQRVGDVAKDNSQLGNGIFRSRLADGNHLIEIKKPGFKDFSQNIDMRREQLLLANIQKSSG